jgi:L-alanine-DL-glutamate epimerase-like enolase superfamily enzyme
MGPEVAIEGVRAAAWRIPTERPERDGTHAWDSTTLVTVHVAGGGKRGFGYSYGSAAMVRLIHDELAPRLAGLDALAVEASAEALIERVRNLGRPGIAATAISALDLALWDLKAKLLGLPLVRLLGPRRPEVPLYGSGGFTSYDEAQLTAQLQGWAEAGIPRVKMKVGTRPADDPARVAAARRAIGPEVELMVDANGAYRAKQALALAEAFAESRVTWFEEPISSDDLAGLRFVVGRVPVGMEIAAGEYGYDPLYFRRMLEAGAVDVLQADATRCLGVTGFLAAAQLCDAFHVPLSAHTAPSAHLHVACAAPSLMHLEYFHDHVRIERALFDGFIEPQRGTLRPDRSRPGIGVELKEADAARYAIRA